MEIDQSKFLNSVVEIANRKINELQSQLIVTEAKLQCVVDINKQLTTQLEKTKKSSKSEFQTP